MNHAKGIPIDRTALAGKSTAALTALSKRLWKNYHNAFMGPRKVRIGAELDAVGDELGKRLREAV